MDLLQPYVTIFAYYFRPSHVKWDLMLCSLQANFKKVIKAAGTGKRGDLKVRDIAQLIRALTGIEKLFNVTGPSS